MRVQRISWLVLASCVAAACSHDEILEVISRDGRTTIPIIDLTTSGNGGFPGGSRAVNKFIVAGPFDTAVTDAFGRATTLPAGWVTAPFPDCGFYGPLIYAPGKTALASYPAPDSYLPALVGTAQATDLVGCGAVVAYIVQSGNAGNGSGNTVWEFWHDFEQLSPNTRYVQGLARYALQQNGALDIAEKMIAGTVTNPDSLVLLAGTVGGKKSTDVFTTSCTSGNIVQPVAAANPHLLGSDVSDASGLVDVDQTVCANAASVWGALGTAKSPVPPNNFVAALGASQYNFFVVWEALADSTPDFTKPVYRVQVGPLRTTGSATINNALGPFPEGQLTALQFGPLPGSLSRPDTMRLTFNLIKPLASGAYQVWLLRTDSAKSQLVTGRVVRLNGATVVDTLNNVSEFNTGGVITGARVEFDVGSYPLGQWNAATLAVAATTGNTTLPAGQPLWTTSVYKPIGVLASFGGTLPFGSFNNGTPVLFGVVGSATGGVFGKELREDIKRLSRPPMGYLYEGWMTHTADTTKRQYLGTILEPYPSAAPLTDADVRQTSPMAGVEITRAALRFLADSAGVYCGFNRVHVRLAPKNGNTGVISPATVLTGTIPACP